MKESFQLHNVRKLTIAVFKTIGILLILSLEERKFTKYNG
jgi:hypothetical protein